MVWTVVSYQGYPAGVDPARGMTTIRRHMGHVDGRPETLGVGQWRSCQPSVSHGAETDARAMRPTCHRNLKIDRFLRHRPSLTTQHVRTSLRGRLLTARRVSNILGLRHFPRKKKAAVPVKARKCPLALSGLQKNGSRWPVPACAFAPHASGTPSSDREDSRLYLTIFILWGVEPVCMTLLVKLERSLGVPRYYER